MKRKIKDPTSDVTYNKPHNITYWAVLSDTNTTTYWTTYDATHVATHNATRNAVYRTTNSATKLITEAIR